MLQTKSKLIYVLNTTCLSVLNNKIKTEPTLWDLQGAVIISATHRMSRSTG